MKFPQKVACSVLALLTLITTLHLLLHSLPSSSSPHLTRQVSSHSRSEELIGRPHGLGKGSPEAERVNDQSLEVGKGSLDEEHVGKGPHLDNGHIGGKFEGAGKGSRMDNMHVPGKGPHLDSDSENQQNVLKRPLVGSNTLDDSYLANDIKVQTIHHALVNLLNSGDADLKALPFELFHNCSPEMSSTRVVGNHFCLGDIEILWELEALGVINLGKMTVLDFKVALFNTLLGALKHYLTHPEPPDKEGVLRGPLIWTRSQVKLISNQLSGLREEREKEGHLRVKERGGNEADVGGGRIEQREQVKEYAINGGFINEQKQRIPDPREQVFQSNDLSAFQCKGSRKDPGQFLQSNDQSAIERKETRIVRPVGAGLAFQDGTLLSNDDHQDYDSAVAKRTSLYTRVKSGKGNPFVMPPPIDGQKTSLKDYPVAQKQPSPSKQANGREPSDFEDRIPPDIRIDAIRDSNAAKYMPQHEGVYHITDSGYKLLGFVVQGYKSLRERGFSESHVFNSTELVKRRVVVDEIISEVRQDRKDLAVRSLDYDLLRRSRMQQYNIEQFCGQNKISKALPSHSFDMDVLFKHLLYDDSKRMVFCYVPKNGCSNMKRMMLILNGLLPPNASLDPYQRPSEAVLGSVKSFRNLTKRQALYRLENYFKFAIVRNPMERLVSAYRNKLEVPFDASVRKKFPDRLKAYILSLYDKKRFMNWIANKRFGRDIHPSFVHFLRFMNKFALNTYNEHFTPFLQLCFPCAIDYDVVLNFKSVNYDVYAAMDYLNIHPSLYPQAIAHKTTPTAQYLREYFGKVSDQGIKSKLFERFQMELGFYYALYPEEAGMHLQLLT